MTINITNTAKIATGETLPFDWEKVGSPFGTAAAPTYWENMIRVTVDTSCAGFTKTPVYFTALYASTPLHHSLTVGVTSIWNPKPTSFEVMIVSFDWEAGGLAEVSIEKAREYGWHIKWFGIQD